jgi:hypothetical protein
LSDKKPFVSRFVWKLTKPILNMNKPVPNKESAFGCPNTFCGTASCLFICATIAFIAWVIASNHPAPPPRLWMPIVVDAKGNQTILGETRQMEFWTPSAETKDYLHTENGDVVDSEKWQVISNDDVVVQFGAMLHSNQDILGYRRVEAWGQGRTSYKPGWWWTLNVYTNYSVVDLAQAYQKFWKQSQPVFIEVIDNRGSND